MPSSILNSDDGVISGTSGLKSSGGDDGVLVFQSKGTETARITATGNVGIGTTSPSYLTEIVGGTGGAETALLQVRSNSTSDNTATAIRLTNATAATSTASCEIASIRGSAGVTSLTFKTSSGSAPAERARIRENGTLSLQGPHSGVFINSTAAITLASGGTVTITATNAGAVLVMVWNNTEGSGLLCFGSYSGTMEKIAGTGAATDTGSTHAIYKSNDSNTITYKNKYGGTRTNWIAVYSALAIA
jgi:hypothetical protein